MLEKVQEDRARKLEQIKELGIDPYGGRYDSAEPIADVLERFEDDRDDLTADIAGRLVLARDLSDSDIGAVELLQEILSHTDQPTPDLASHG